MNTYEPLVIGAAASAPRPDRPATAIVHDGPDARLVVFRLEAGQTVPQHMSTSTVILSIAAGSGMVSGATGEQPVRSGDLVTFDPNEPHGMRALSNPMVVLAVITPRPR